MTDQLTPQPKPTVEDVQQMIKLFGLEDTVTILISTIAHRDNLIVENERRAAAQIRRLAQEAGLNVTIGKRPRKRGRPPAKP